MKDRWTRNIINWYNSNTLEQSQQLNKSTQKCTTHTKRLIGYNCSYPTNESDRFNELTGPSNDILPKRHKHLWTLYPFSQKGKMDTTRSLPRSLQCKDHTHVSKGINLTATILTLAVWPILDYFSIMKNSDTSMGMRKESSQLRAPG